MYCERSVLCAAHGINICGMMQIYQIPLFLYLIENRKIHTHSREWLSVSDWVCLYVVENKNTKRHAHAYIDMFYMYLEYKYSAYNTQYIITQVHKTRALCRDTGWLRARATRDVVNDNDDGCSGSDNGATKTTTTTILCADRKRQRKRFTHTHNLNCLKLIDFYDWSGDLIALLFYLFARNGIAEEGGGKAWNFIPCSIYFPESFTTFVLTSDMRTKFHIWKIKTTTIFSINNCN